SGYDRSDDFSVVICVLHSTFRDLTFRTGPNDLELIGYASQRSRKYMQPSHRANSLWLQSQQFKSSAAYRLLTAQPWALAFIRAEFTADRSRVALELFHASLDSFLKQARKSDDQIPSSYSAQDFAETWVKQGILARPLIDGRFIYEPRAQTLRTLRFLACLRCEASHRHSSRPRTRLSSRESRARETAPGPEARTRALQSRIASRQAPIDQPRSGDDRAVLSRTTAA